MHLLDLQAALDQAENKIEAIENGVETPPCAPIRIILSPSDIPDGLISFNPREI